MYIFLYINPMAEKRFKILLQFTRQNDMGVPLVFCEITKRAIIFFKRTWECPWCFWFRGLFLHSWIYVHISVHKSYGWKDIQDPITRQEDMGVPLVFCEITKRAIIFFKKIWECPWLSVKLRNMSFYFQNFHLGPKRWAAVGSGLGNNHWDPSFIDFDLPVGFQSSIYGWKVIDE